MLYHKKMTVVICLAICFSLSADSCTETNVKSKADQLQKDANTLQANATTLENEANILKKNATDLKATLSALQADYIKLETLQQNSDALDDAVGQLTALSAPKK